jgi:photosystem II stability/assembly factor-like uncharacterized protein
MVSPSVVFAAGKNGRMIRSDDGGRSWRAQPVACASCPGVLHFAQLDMLNSETGWAAATVGLFKTTDGEHWVEQPTGLDHEPAVVQFVTPNDGWIVTAAWGAGEFIGLPDAVVARTTDAGATWTPLTGLPPDVQSICFSALDEGWLATRSAVYRSTDGGSSWQLSLQAAVTPTPGSGVATLECSAPGAAWVEFAPGGAAAGSSPWILYGTADGGQQWTPVAGKLIDVAVATEAGGSYPSSFTIVDPRTVFIADHTPAAVQLSGSFVTINGSIVPVRVTDQGESASFFTPTAASFFDADHGVLVGDTNPGLPSVYTTSDAGNTWSPIDVGSIGPVLSTASSAPTTDCSPFRALVTEADAGGEVDVEGVGTRFSICLDEASHPLRQLDTSGCALGAVSNLSVRGPDTYPIGFEATAVGACTIRDGDYEVRIVVSG